MGVAKVYNDNQYPHVEKFKGKTIEIPAKEFIEMDRDEALQFQGQFRAPRKRGDGTDDPRFFKKIRVVGGEDKEKYNPLTNPITGQVAESKEQLEAQLKQYRHLLIEDDKQQDKAAKANRRIEELEAKLNELTDLIRSQTNAKTKPTAKG